jgi:hypothetical protein
VLKKKSQTSIRVNDDERNPMAKIPNPASNCEMAATRLLQRKKRNPEKKMTRRPGNSLGNSSTVLARFDIWKVSARKLLKVESTMLWENPMKQTARKKRE